MKLQSQKFPQYLSKHRKEQQIPQAEWRSLQESTFRKQNFQICDILGNYEKSFIVMHHNGELYLVDQHAASQKSLFQQFLAGHQNSKSIDTASVSSIVSVANLYGEIYNDRRMQLEQKGWKYQVIEKKSWTTEIRITEVPCIYGVSLNEQDFIHQIKILYERGNPQNSKDNKLMARRENNQWQRKWGHFREYQDIPHQDKDTIVEQSTTQTYSDDTSKHQKFILATHACHTAYRIGDKLNNNQMRGLLNSLYNMTAPFNCPHGRPVMIKIGSAQLFCQEYIINYDI